MAVSVNLYHVISYQDTLPTPATRRNEDRPKNHNKRSKVESSQRSIPCGDINDNCIVESTSAKESVTSDACSGGKTFGEEQKHTGLSEKTCTKVSIPSCSSMSKIHEVPLNLEKGATMKQSYPLKGQHVLSGDILKCEYAQRSTY